MKFANNFSELLVVFNKHYVNYMVVGGYAVNFHGYERTTSDMDIWVKPERENLEKICSALAELNFDRDALNHIRTFNVAKPFLFHVGDKPDDVEIFNFITGVKYEDAEPHKVPFAMLMI